MSQTKVEAPFVENNVPFKNFCINGDMKFNQRGSSSVTGLGAGGEHYLVDRTRTYSVTTAGRYTISQETDVPSGLGFTNSLKMQCTTADTSIAAGELTLIQHRMEGQFLQSIAKGTSSAKQLTVSFYAKANEARVHSLEVKDEDNTRHCAKLFTTTTDWKRHVLTFPADTTGALDNDNAQSISLNFFMHAGSNYTGGTLQSGSFAAISNGNRAAGIGSIMASTDNNFFITGLQMELGDTATDFEFVPHDVQLQRCKRYFQNVSSTAQAYICNSWYYTDTKVIGIGHFSPEMRATPSLDAANVTDAYVFYAEGAGDNLSDLGLGSSSSQVFVIDNDNNVADTNSAGAAGGLYRGNNSAYVHFSAEL